jgi:hypothetical protein
MSDFLFQPYLTVVAASRNDDHGGDPLTRTQIFLDNLAQQAESLQLPCEILLVDWNPPADRPDLSQAIDWSFLNAYCHARVVQVPAEIHQRSVCGDKLPLLQMIAKNVGIRRARGEFVLATNIDILFSDELMRFLAQRNLKKGYSYRTDRLDIESGVPAQASSRERLAYAWDHTIRLHQRGKTDFLTPGNPITATSPILFNNPAVFESNQDGDHILRLDVPIDMVHTNACGDFTLLHRDDWERIGGYAEFDLYSFHIDSLGCLSAHYSGIREYFLPIPCATFHIEHSIGSGWSPEGQERLFTRLAANKIWWLPWSLVSDWVKQIRQNKQPLPFNKDNWGLSDINLPETSHQPQ